MSCSMGHGDAGYCEHCPGKGGRGTGNGDVINVSRPALAVGAHSDRRDASTDMPRGWESLDDTRGVCDVCGAGVCGECICGDVLPVAEEMDGSREELRTLDAVACAEGAEHEFAESIETDVRYALTQLRGFRREYGMRAAMDRISRALDALESVEGRIAAVTCE